MPLHRSRQCSQHSDYADDPRSTLKDSHIGIYQLGKKIGKGSFSIVQYAVNTLDNSEVAIKIINLNHDKNSHAATELRVLRDLSELPSHPLGLLRVLDAVSLPESQSVAIVFPFADGGDLYDYLDTCVKQQGGTRGFDEDACRYVFLQVVEAVARLHTLGWVHKDIKLENCLLFSTCREQSERSSSRASTPCRPSSEAGSSAGASDDAAATADDVRSPALAPIDPMELVPPTDGGNTGIGRPAASQRLTSFRVVLADFGLACSSQRSVCAERFVGSLHYTAPELVAEKDRCAPSKASDVWSLGCLLYILATGRMPFPSLHNDELIEAVRAGARAPSPPFLSKALGDLLDNLLSFDPSARMAAAQIRQHPWVRGVCSPPVPLPPRSMLSKCTSIRDFDALIALLEAPASPAPTNSANGSTPVRSLSKTPAGPKPQAPSAVAATSRESQSREPSLVAPHSAGNLAAGTPHATLTPALGLSNSLDPQTYSLGLSNSLDPQTYSAPPRLSGTSSAGCLRACESPNASPHASELTESPHIRDAIRSSSSQKSAIGPQRAVQWCARSGCPNSTRNTKLMASFCPFHVCTRCDREKSSNAQFCSQCQKSFDGNESGPATVPANFSSPPGSIGCASRTHPQFPANASHINSMERSTVHGGKQSGDTRGPQSCQHAGGCPNTTRNTKLVNGFCVYHYCVGCGGDRSSTGARQLCAGCQNKS